MSQKRKLIEEDNREVKKQKKLEIFSIVDMVCSVAQYLQGWDLINFKRVNKFIHKATKEMSNIVKVNKNNYSSTLNTPSQAYSIDMESMSQVWNDEIELCHPEELEFTKIKRVILDFKGISLFQGKKISTLKHFIESWFPNVEHIKIIRLANEISLTLDDFVDLRELYIESESHINIVIQKDLDKLQKMTFLTTANLHLMQHRDFLDKIECDANFFTYNLY